MRRESLSLPATSADQLECVRTFLSESTLYIDASIYIYLFIQPSYILYVHVHTRTHTARSPSDHAIATPPRHSPSPDHTFTPAVRDLTAELGAAQTEPANSRYTFPGEMGERERKGDIERGWREEGVEGGGGREVEGGGEERGWGVLECNL